MKLLPLRFGKETFPALTGIRAIAAYIVFFDHYTPSAALVSTPVHNLLAEGHVGVTLFYVLSGFLITYCYWDRAEGLSGPFWVQYLGRRIARIYPLYLFLLALTFLIPVLLWHEAMPNFPTVMLNATLLKGFFALFNFSGIGPSWSLTVEETFYLLAPVIFVLVRKAGYATAQAVLYGAGALLLLVGVRTGFYGFFGNFTFVAVYTFFGRSFEFLSGMALARFLAARPKLMVRSRRSSCTVLGILGSLLAIYWMSLLQENGEFGLFHPIGIALNNLALPVFICILLWGLISESTIIGRILSSRSFVFLGRSSYSFYLVHYGILAFLIRSRLTIANELFRLAVFFILVNIVAALLFLVVEHPANQYIRWGIDRWIKSPAPVASEEPGRIFRRYAVAWSSSFAIIFLTWCGVHFDWLRPAVTTGEHAQAAMRGAPSLGHLISAKSDYYVVTSQVGEIGTLTYLVAGASIVSQGFIFAHANSKVEYDIASMGRSRFEFSTGLDDFGGADLGSVTYLIRGDGRTLFQTPVVRALEPARRYSVDVAGVRRLELIVTDAGDGPNSDEAYWINPVLR